MVAVSAVRAAAEPDAWWQSSATHPQQAAEQRADAVTIPAADIRSGLTIATQFSASPVTVQAIRLRLSLSCSSLGCAAKMRQISGNGGANEARDIVASDDCAGSLGGRCGARDCPSVRWTGAHQRNKGGTDNGECIIG
jgi:hypothetical protein